MRSLLDAAAPGLHAVSCVLPVYNEVDNIALAVSSAASALARHTADFEIIAVDDGSTDGTSALLDTLASAEPSLRVLHVAGNRGYGAALRAGFAAAQKPFVFFMDSDNQFDPMDIGRLLEVAGEADLVVGRRVGRRDGGLRALLSSGYNMLVRALLGIRVRDVNCAFKLARTGALSSLRLSSPGYSINAEMIARATEAGMRVAEVGVSHRPRTAGHSKVGLLDIPHSLVQLLGVRRAMRLALASPSPLGDDAHAHADHSGLGP